MSDLILEEETYVENLKLKENKKGRLNNLPSLS